MIEILNIKLIICILCTPKFQKIINSLFSSYLVVTQKRLKNNTNGKILLKIFGKFNKEKFMFKNEISKNIKVLREVFKLNGNYKVTFVADSVYEIKKV